MCRWHLSLGWCCQSSAQGGHILCNTHITESMLVLRDRLVAVWYQAGKSNPAGQMEKPPYTIADISANISACGLANQLRTIYELRPGPVHIKLHGILKPY